MTTSVMISADTGSRTIRLASPGHAAFAAVMVGLGILGVVQGGFTSPWSGVPKGFPARGTLAYLCAFNSLGAGIALLGRRTAVVAARALLLSFGLWFLLFRVPLIIRAPGTTATWWASGYTAAMVASCWILYTWFAGDWDRQRFQFVSGTRGLRVARALFGLALIPFGVAHFTFLERTVSLVPGWLPWHVPLAILTGSAFVAAGLAVLTGVCARLAARLAALQLGLFGILVWIPILLGHPTVTDLTEFITTCVLTAAAWVVAESYGGAPGWTWNSRSRGE